MSKNQRMAAAPNQRSFSLNSDEAYDAICPRPDRPWIMAGSLPRDPRVWDREVVVEKGGVVRDGRQNPPERS